MKKTLILLLALALALSILAGCGANTGSSEAESTQAPGDLSSVKTMGDLTAIQGVTINQYATYSDIFVGAFDLNDTTYRVIAPISEDAADAIFELDWEDDAHDEKMFEILAPFEVESIVDLLENTPSQEELDALVGKTGEELLEDGWSCWGWNLNDMQFWMNHDVFSFSVIMDGTVEDPDAFDSSEDIADFTVVSVTYDGLGDVTNIEYN